MTTTAVTLTENYQQIAEGACTIQFASTFSDGAPAVGDRIASNPEYNFIRLHIGAVAPADDTFDYMEALPITNYTGTEKVFARAHVGERVVKVTTIV